MWISWMGHSGIKSFSHSWMLMDNFWWREVNFHVVTTQARIFSCFLFIIVPQWSREGQAAPPAKVPVLAHTSPGAELVPEREGSQEVWDALVGGTCARLCPAPAQGTTGQGSGSTALTKEKRAEMANSKMLPCWTCTLISDNTRTILQVFVSHHLLCFSKVKITWSLQNLIISAVASKNKNPMSTTH